MLTTQDIKQKQFSKKLRGYESKDVDKFKNDVLSYVTFLRKELNKAKEEASNKEVELMKAKKSIKELMTKAQEIESTISQLDKTNSNLKEENRELLKEINKYREREDSIKEIMFLAKKTADEIIMKAKIEGKNIVKNTEEQQKILQNKIKTLENRIMKLRKDFSEIVNYHATSFENEINKIEPAMDDKN